MDTQIEERKLKAIEEKAQYEFENRISSARVSALDPDFILILSFVAIPFDIAIAFLSIFDIFFGISWVIKTVISIPPFIIILIWNYSRTSNLSKTKEDANNKLNKIKNEIKHHRENIIDKKATQETFKKTGKEVGEEAVKAGKQIGKEIGDKTSKEVGGEIGKQVGKEASKKTVKTTAVKISSKIVFKRGILSFLGSIIPFFLAMIPIYSIWVFSTLKDK